MELKPKTFFDETPPGDPTEKDYKFAVFGVPWDLNTTQLNGSSKRTPECLRSLSGYVATATELEENIFDFGIVDFGDVIIQPPAFEKNIKRIEELLDIIFTNKNLEDPPIPVMIGGDHFCTYPVVRMINNIYKEKSNKSFGFLSFDAHLDYYDKWLEEEEYMHCTITKRVAEIPEITPQRVIVFGTRDIDTPELKQAEEDGLKYIPAYKISPKGRSSNLDKSVEELIKHYKDKDVENLYISIDIDVLDGAAASGTGYVFPGGISYRELWYILFKIVENFNIIGFDLVEVAPDLDTPSNLTQNTAIKLIVELMGFIYMKRKGRFEINL